MNKYEKAVDTWALRGVGQPFGAHTGVGKDLRQALVDICTAADLETLVGSQHLQAHFALIVKENEGKLAAACDALEAIVGDANDSYSKLVAACRTLAAEDSEYRELLLKEVMRWIS